MRARLPILSAAVVSVASAGFAEPVYFAGTGHYYEAVKVPTGITRDHAGEEALAKGGYLACISSVEENDFAYSLVNDLSWFTPPSQFGDRLGPWLGGISTSTGWQWNTGEPFTYSNWKPGQPDTFAGFYQYLLFYNGNEAGSSWGDHPGGAIPGFELPRGYVIEYNTLPSGYIPQEVRLEIEKTGLEEVTLSWSADATGWTLEYLVSPFVQWQTFPTAPVISAGKFRVPDTTLLDKH
ncbi:MAG: hypothetical protein EOP83_15940, partial [Verrucomicrobiaceae bacterium]